jgi:hypothetical protein
MFNKICLTGLFTFITTLAFAYDASSPTTTVDYVYTDINGSIYVQFAPGGMPGCYADSGAYVKTENADGKAQLYSGLLAAKAKKSNVVVLYDYTGVISGWSMCHIHGIYFK